MFFVFDCSLCREKNGIKIETSENTKVTKASKSDVPRNGGKFGDKKGSNDGDNPEKFKNYFNFQNYLNNMHSHQIMAINRAENLKVFLH